jgi:hypothetical protein
VISEPTGHRTLIGNLDGFADGCLFGWAYDRLNPDRTVDVDLLVGGRRVLTVPADDYRGDLPGAGIGTGHHAFSVELPARLLAAGPAEVRVRFGGTDQDLAGSPCRIDGRTAGIPLRSLKLVRADDLIAAAVAHTATDLPVLRATPVGQGGPGRFRARVVVPQHGAIGVETVDRAMPEPPAQSLSMPFARICPWGAFGDRPGRIVDASFQFFDPAQYAPAPPAGPGQHLIDPRHWRDWVELDEEVVHFTRPGVYNYYHWTIDVLPQLWVWRQAPFADRRLLLNRRDLCRPSALSAGEVAVRRDCLRALGICDQQLVEVDADVIDAPVVHVPSVSLALILGQARPLYDEIRANLAGEVGAAQERLYVTRRQAGARRIVNEDQVVECLGRHGFRVVALEGMSLAEQVGLFAGARMVVAPHGAGLANLAYMPGGGSLLEILPANQRDREWIFGRVAAAFGHRRVVLLADPVPADAVDPDVMVDLAALEMGIEMMMDGTGM